jgi:hypothetical protein
MNQKAREKCYLGPIGDESDTEMQTTANVTSNKENIDNFILAADWRSCSTTNVTIDSKSTAFLYSKTNICKNSPICLGLVLSAGNRD